MYRHGIWNVNPPHPSHAWSPLPVGYLYIDYGDAPVVKLPKVWRASATRTLIDIPMNKCLYAVLCGRPSGPLVENNEGHLVPALGASGPEVSSSKPIRVISNSATDIIRVQGTTSSLHSRCSLASRASQSVLGHMERFRLMVQRSKPADRSYTKTLRLCSNPVEVQRLCTTANEPNPSPIAYWASI